MMREVERRARCWAGELGGRVRAVWREVRGSVPAAGVGVAMIGGWIGGVGVIDVAEGDDATMWTIE